MRCAPRGAMRAPPMTVASNIDLAESDFDADGSAGSRRGSDWARAGGAVPPGANVSATDQEQERNQRIWWYLLFAGVWSSSRSETFIGNRVATPAVCRRAAVDSRVTAGGARAGRMVSWITGATRHD